MACYFKLLIDRNVFDTVKLQPSFTSVKLIYTSGYTAGAVENRVGVRV
jgi:hypothetical protein